MSKLSRKLALLQGLFTLASLPVLVMWSYALGKRGVGGPFFSLWFLFAALCLLGFAMKRAVGAAFDTPGYRVVQGILILLHLLAVAYILILTEGQLPSIPDAFSLAAEGLGAFSLYNLGEALTVPVHIIALLIGAVPLALPMMPAVRAKL